MQDVTRKTRDAGGSAGPETVAPERTPQAGDYGLQVLPPLSAVMELAGMVALIMAIDWVWPSLDINSLQPSPYWVPVLLLSLQYGTASGSLAVIAAIIAYFTFVTLPEQGVGENEFAYRLRVLAQPILWISTAVVLGQFRMVQIAAKREMARRVQELEAQTRTLADFAARLRMRCDLLERDIVSRNLPGNAPLLDSLSALQKGAADHGEIARCFAAALPGACMSLFVRHGITLTRFVSTGWPAKPGLLTVLPVDHPLVALVAGNKRSLCVLNPGDEAGLAGQGIAAVPVIDGNSGRVTGMIKVETCDAALVTSALTGHLQVLASAVSTCLGEASSQFEAEVGGAAQPLRPQLVRPKAGI